MTFLGLICNGELASVNVHESSSSASTAKRKSENTDSLANFSWQTWLLVDPQNGFQHGIDSATLLRRITPKSVFIAPELPACADGYRADKMGRCVKMVNIDQEAHRSFLLDRLNAMFSAPPVFADENDQRKGSTGPYQLNIPLIFSNSKPSSMKIEPEETSSMNDPVEVPSPNETHPDDEGKTKPHQTAIANKYEMKNDTILDEEETTFLLENSNTDDFEFRKVAVGVAVPVTDLVEETNDTSFSEVVDYESPTDLKTSSLNISSVKRLNASDVMRNAPTTKKPEDFTEMSPTLILLIPSTKLPSVANDLPITQNETTHAIVQIPNVAPNETAKEVIAVSVPDSALTSADKLAVEVPSIATDEQRDNETRTDDEAASESSKLNESQETELVYDGEEEDSEYSYNTDIPDEQDLVELENEEILRHGEAGMTIPTRNVEGVHHDQQQQNQTTDYQKKTLETRDQIMIRFNDSASMPAEDKDEAGSNVSSEVSIDGDVILETTLLDVNTEKLQATTKSPDAIRKITKNSDDNHEESFKDFDTEPKVIFSQEAHGTTFTSLQGRKRSEHLTKLEDKKNDEVIVTLSSIESLLYNYPEEDPITEIRMTDKEQSTVKKSTRENSKDFQLNAPANDFKQTTMNLGSAENYVTLLDYAKQPQVDGYVRFPSSEANSIHSLGYKQQSHPIDDVSPHGTSTKSSVPVRQKPVHYLPSWKPERLQIDHVPTSDRQRQRPDLLDFWNKMPLVRDPGVRRGDQAPDDEAADDTRKPHRFHRGSRGSRIPSFFTPEISSENVNRVHAPKQRLRID